MTNPKPELGTCESHPGHEPHEECGECWAWEPCEPLASPQEQERCAYFDYEKGKVCGLLHDNRVHAKYGNDLDNEWMHVFEPGPSASAGGRDDDTQDVKVFWPYEFIRSVYEPTYIRLITDNCTPEEAADGLRKIADWLLEATQ